MARHVLLELKLDQVCGRRTRHVPCSHSLRAPIALACRPHLLRAGPPRLDAHVPNMPAAARPGTFDGSATRRSRCAPC